MSDIPNLENHISTAADLQRQINDAVTARHDRLATLKSERAKIVASPVTRADYIAQIFGEIDKRAAAYKEKLKTSFVESLQIKQHSLQNIPYPATVENAINFSTRRADRQLGTLPGRLRGAHFGGDSDLDPLSQLAATFFVREEMKAAAAEAINAINPWPHPEARPLAESIARISAIDEEVLSIHSELGTLARDAGKIGLSIPLPRADVETSKPGSWDWLQMTAKEADVRKEQERIDDPSSSGPLLIKDGVAYQEMKNHANGEVLLRRV